MKSIYTIFFCLLCFATSAQSNELSDFEELIGGKWISEGKQLGGFEGRTEYQFSWGLEKKIVRVKTFTTDPKTGVFAQRNEGIRIFNTTTKSLELYEFDKTGGVTTGLILATEDAIHYNYQYEGMQLRDSWIQLNTNEYQITIGEWKDGQWNKIFHQTIVKRSQ